MNIRIVIHVLFLISCVIVVSLKREISRFVNSLELVNNLLLLIINKKYIVTCDMSDRRLCYIDPE